MCEVRERERAVCVCVLRAYRSPRTGERLCPERTGHRAQFFCPLHIFCHLSFCTRSRVQGPSAATAPKSREAPTDPRAGARGESLAVPRTSTVPSMYHEKARTEKNDVRTSATPCWPPHLLHQPPFPTTTLAAARPHRHGMSCCCAGLQGQADRRGGPPGAVRIPMVRLRSALLQSPVGACQRARYA